MREKKAPQNTSSVRLKVELAILGALLIAVWLVGTKARPYRARTTAPNSASLVNMEGIYQVLEANRPWVADEHLEDALPPPPQATPDQPTVALAVLDTVRFDHTSVCGYDRQTTPFLEEVARRGASVTCRAYVPSD